MNREEKWIKMNVDEAQKLPADGLYYVCKGRYWAVKDSNIYFYRSYTSPQCNSQLEVMKVSPLVKNDGAEIVKIETVFIPHTCEDYL